MDCGEGYKEGTRRERTTKTRRRLDIRNFIQNVNSSIDHSLLLYQSAGKDCQAPNSDSSSQTEGVDLGGNQSDQCSADFAFNRKSLSRERYQHKLASRSNESQSGPPSVTASSVTKSDYVRRPELRARSKSRSRVLQAVSQQLTALIDVERSKLDEIELEIARFEEIKARRIRLCQASEPEISESMTPERPTCEGLRKEEQTNSLGLQGIIYQSTNVTKQTDDMPREELCTQGGELSVSKGSVGGDSCSSFIFEDLSPSEPSFIVCSFGCEIAAVPSSNKYLPTCSLKNTKRGGRKHIPLHDRSTYLDISRCRFNGRFL